MHDGKYFLLYEVVRLIVYTKGSSNHLLSRMLNDIVRDRSALIKIYREGVALKTVEPLVLSLLQTIAQNEGEPLRPEILKAIRDVGGPDCLPVVQYLLVDWVGTRDRKRSLATAIGHPQIGNGQSEALLAQTVLESFTQTIQLGEQAIAAIQARAAPSHQLEDKLESTNHDFVARTLPEWEYLVQREVVELSRSMRSGSAREKLTQIRRCSEAVVSVYYLRRQLGGLDAKKKTLGDLLKQVKSSLELEADWVFRQFEALNCLTRIAAHSSHAGFDDITPADIKAVETLHDNVMRWYGGLSIAD
ncbi:hypothetical protein RFUL19S_04357 [Rhizobacter fulvus]